MGIVGCDGTVDFHRKPCFLHTANVSGDSLKGIIPAQVSVGFAAAAVEGHIHSGGGILHQHIQQLVSQQRSIGIDGNHQAKTAQLRIDLRKILPQKRLAAGDQKEQHTGIPGCSAQFDPLLCGHFHGRTYILMDIAHPAGEITPGRNLKGAGKRNCLLIGSDMQIGRNQSLATGHYSCFRILHTNTSPNPPLRFHPYGRNTGTPE